MFDQIAGHVVHGHVKVARAAPDASFTGMAVPSQDDVPHAELLAALTRSGFDGIITIDPHYGQFAEADKPTDVEEPVLEVVRRTLDCLPWALVT